MKEEKAREYVINDIIRRFKEELREHNKRVTVMKLRDDTEEEAVMEEELSEYLEETIEKTENKRDVIGTSELYDKWEKWMRERHRTNRGMQQKLTIGLTHFGRELNKQYKKQVLKTRDNKTIRGFECIKYKNEEGTKVEEFMIKHIENTEDSILDRIPLKEVYYKYLEWGEGERMGPEKFQTEVTKTGEYKTKQASLKREVERRNGKTKVESIGGKYETQLCVMKVKWKDKIAVL